MINLRNYLQALTLMLVYVAGCAQPISKMAPTIVQVEGIEPKLSGAETPHIDYIKWRASVLIPNESLENWGSTEESPGGDIYLDGHIWKLGAITASTSLEGNKIRLDCSNGSAGVFSCFSNNATIEIICERMIFKFTCSKMFNYRK